MKELKRELEQENKLLKKAIKQKDEVIENLKIKIDKMYRKQGELQEKSRRRYIEIMRLKKKIGNIGVIKEDKYEWDEYCAYVELCKKANVRKCEECNKTGIYEGDKLKLR